MVCSRIRHMRQALALALIAGFLFVPDATCGASGLAPGRTTYLTIPNVPGPNAVYLPTNTATGRTWPLLVHYHGADGRANVETWRRYTRGRDWVLLGMEYSERGARRRSPQQQRRTLAAESRNLHRAVAFLAEEVGIDSDRIYLAGFSKGGWWASMLGEYEIERIAGMIILGAGRPRTERALPRELNGKPIYIGVGSEEINWMPARRAAVVYRRMGARVSFEEFAGLGHAVPDHAPGLADWLEAAGPLHAGRRRPATEEALVDWYRTAYASALQETNGILQHRVLLQLATNAKLALCGSTARRQVARRLKQLRAENDVAVDWMTQQRLDELLWKEFKMDTLDDMQAVVDGLRGLAKEFPDTPSGARAGAHAERVEAALTESREATDAARDRAAREAAEKESRAAGRDRLKGTTRRIRRIESE